ncbi:E3 ubiquitin-protein ligase UPL1 [Acorus gramineus]|uniref:HECT-type E3 ubiquitin transferase n=1 Tax=Acorus gramineus TaxID=55184 RepID=A0AAV9BD61_ACOGR|nr:E3 ubiquitin-protein ligase UPL1 [Acorus gramineus]
MKLKRRRAFEVPPKIRSFINNVTSAPLEKIEELLKGFTWEYDKGDFHHWVDLFTHFDTYFEKCVRPRKDLQLEDTFLESDPPFPREAILQILRVSRIILENCTNKHFYSSYEHLSSLLASTDVDVVEASLTTLAACLKKTTGRCPLRDATLTSKLFAFSQGWGAKEEGVGLIACSVESGCDPVAQELGSILHFQFYQVDDTSKEIEGVEQLNQGLQVIHLPNISSYSETDLELLNKLVTEYKVPPNLRFSLLTRLRFARAFGSLPTRQQYVCIRLYAFMVLVQSSGDADDLASFFNNEPEFVNELVSLLSYEDAVPEKIRILGVLSLVALCQDRTRQSTVLTSVTSGGHRGILPSLMQKAISSIAADDSSRSIIFAEALLSLVTILVSSSSGCTALREAGLIPTLLPLLKDTNPQHLHLVSNAVHILEAFMDYSNPAAALFRDLGGLDDTIARLKVEVSYVDNGPKKHEEELDYSRKGKQILYSSDELDAHPLYSEALVTYHRRLLMKALLRAISLGTYAPGNTGRVYGSEENLLPHCLCTIFRRAKEFGGGVFSLAATVMSDLIHKDPTCFPVLEAADLPSAFLDAILGGVLCSAEAISCIPQCLDALCLNNTGLQAVKDRNALRCFVKIFTSRTYLRALSGDTPGSLSTGLDELMRHASSLRGLGVDMLIEILNTILKIGSEAEPFPSSIESSTSSAATPMETDQEEGSFVSQDEAESSRMGSIEQPLESSSSDGSSISVESFLPECISNVARLLEAVLQNADTCRLFIEKKGVEAVLQLFTLPLMPYLVSIGQSVVAFKNFSPQHSVTLAQAVCSFLREQLMFANELLDSVSGIRLAELEGAKQMKVLKSLSSLEGLLSLSNFLLKGTTTMTSELGSADADVLNYLGRAYKEVQWQISLISDSKADEKRDAEQEVGIPEATVSNSAGRESDDDANLLPVIRYMNPASVRHGSMHHWSEVSEQEFLSVIRSGDGMHRHGRHGLSRSRGGRISRQLDSHIDLDSSSSSLEMSPLQDVKKKSPDVLVSEVLNKLASAVRSFHSTLAKGFMGPRRRADSTSASRSIAASLAKIFHEALSYSGHSTAGLEMKLSVKCRYLGRVVDDMASLVFDSRRRSCNTVLVNSFYVHGTFKELLATYGATSQLLWTPSYYISTSDVDQGKAVDGNKLSHSSWLLDTLQSYCRLLEYFVSPSLLLSQTSLSHAELLVQPFAPELSIGLFPVPKDASLFIRLLQSQVLEVILPVWNHTMFPNCHPTFITSMVSVITHIYSGVGDVKPNRNGITGSTSQRLTGPPLDEGAIAIVVEMGFSRARAEEAFRHVGSNSIELATDWLFSHPEESLQENEDMKKAVALSLGNSSETSKEDIEDSTKDELAGVAVPPVDDILAASMRLFQCGDSMAFPLTDLLVTLCNRNKGEDRQKVALFLIQQLKLCSSEFSNEMGKLFSASYIWALLLSEDSGTRDIAAENRIVSAALDILSNFSARKDLREGVSATKCMSALLLILDHMLQPKTKVPSESAEGVLSGSLANSSAGDASLRSIESDVDFKSSSDAQHKESCSALEKILGKSTGRLSLEESQRTLAVACDLIKQHVPAVVMQAVLQLCARLTKTHAIAMQFLESGSLAALLNLPRSSFFPGFDSLASSIIRHLLEDPQTLQTAMEWEIRQTLAGVLSRHSGRLTPRTFLTSLAPVIARDPVTFMRASAAVCQLDSNGGRMNVVLSKEREKDKEKSKTPGGEHGVFASESIRMPETKPNDASNKCSRGHKRIPPSMTQVVDQLLEIIMNYPSPKKQEECASSSTPMEVDESSMKEKGKSKVDYLKKADYESVSERSAELAKVTFVLKLMSDILLMYVHAMGVVLKRDSETSQLRISNQADGLGHGGILHHILNHLLPISSDKSSDATDEWKEKLSDKASWFLVVLCGRSSEGRRRVIYEIVKALSSFANSESNSSKNVVLPNKRVLIFIDLVNSILSKNPSASNLPSPACSPDVAKTMIDGGMVKSLTSMLQVMDLDHPGAPKVVDLILKALESLTRVANASEQVFKLDGPNKKKSSGTNERSGDQTNPVSAGEVPEHGQDASNQHEEPDAVPSEQQHQSSSLDERNHDVNIDQPQGMGVDMEDTDAAHLPMEHGSDFMQEEMVEGHVLHDADRAGIPFHVEQRTNDDTGDDDEDMGDDGEDEDDDDDDDEEDEDVAEEGAGLMSLADTDVEDHDENGLGDDYNDDMVDEEDDDFHENNVIEVRWRGGFEGLDHLRVLGRSGDANGFIDIAAEPFQGVNVEDIFGVRRSLTVERRRHNSNRTFLDRSEGSAFQHPLLLRPSQSGDQNIPTWSSSGNSSRDLEASSVGGFDLAHFYMLDSLVQSENAANIFGDRWVGASAPSFFDFSFGADPLHVTGRRGTGDGRWTDDCQPQAGSQAAAIAQAVEEQFISQLRSIVDVNNPSLHGRSQNAVGQETENLNAPTSIDDGRPVVVTNNMVIPQSENQPQEGLGISSALEEERPGVEGDQSINVEPAIDEAVEDRVQEYLSTDSDGLNTTCNASASMPNREGNEPADDQLENATDLAGLAACFQAVDPLGQNGSELLPNTHDMAFIGNSTNGHLGTEIYSSSDARIDSNSELPDASDAHGGSVHISVDVDMDSLDAVGNQAESNEPPAEQNTEVPQDALQADDANANNETSNSSAIDPTFLEALPEDLRAEVLASQQAQPVQIGTYAPPSAEDIDPEFLAALPPDIQAEVLAQQRAQRISQSQQAEGQPVDMDNASILATFPPDLREEVLLSSSEAFLSALPSPLLAEAQMLRANRLFRGSQRLSGRRNGIAFDRQAVMDRGVGASISRRPVSAFANSLKVKEMEGTPLLDPSAVKALLRLLRLAQLLAKSCLQRLLLNLCAHRGTRAILVSLLLDMIRPEADGCAAVSVTPTSQRLYGCQWNVVYGRSQLLDGLPPLVSRRILEVLTCLATNHTSFANLLFYFDSSLVPESAITTRHENNEKDKGKTVEGLSGSGLETSQKGDIPLILFLKLLNRPLFLRSNAHLEQVMVLVQVVVNSAVSKIDFEPLSESLSTPGGIPAQSVNGAPQDAQKESSASEQNDDEKKDNGSTEAPSSSGKENVNLYDIFLQLPESELRNLCNILAHEGLSEKVYTLAAEVVKKLASGAASHRKFFASELADLAHNLSGSAVGELVTLRSTHMLGLSAGSMAGSAILRVLQALHALTSAIDGIKKQEIEGEQEEQTIMWKLNGALEPLWQELSDCITMMETKLGQNSTFTSPMSSTNIGDVIGGASSSSPPLPPGTQRLLPFIEAFFVLSEKLQTNHLILQTDNNVTAREVKECAGSSSASSVKPCVAVQKRSDGSMTFARFADKHRRLLNAFIRQNPGLLEKSLSIMLKAPRLIDFDNKRAYFRSKIRQQHEQHPSAPLRISVRRAYVLEDSYNQLRMRSTQDLKGRLTVQFQGEEGIDAGGLTREWYQLLSRVIFDKGALLFTTVGNNTTFQPNPNSVYQTEHLSYFKFVGRVVAKALFDGQLLDVYFTRSFYKHILGVKVTYHDIEAVDPDYYKNLKWMLENDVSEIPDLTFSMDADEEKHILYEKTEVMDYELKPGGRNIRVTEETKHEYVDLVAEHILTNAIRPQINCFLEGFNELVPRELISIFNDKELELLISGLPEIDFDDLQANTEYTGYTAASSVVQWFWEVAKAFNKEDMARLLQFVTGTSKVPLEGFKALQGISGPQRFQIHKAYGAPERLPSAHTCFNQLDIPEYSTKEQLRERLLLAIHEASEGFGFG